MADLKLDIPASILHIIHQLERSGYEAYIVGGAVRDLLTPRPVLDWDFTTNATPQEILKVFPKGFYDNKFGTVGLENSITPGNPFDITTFRKEIGYSDRRHPDHIHWGKTLEEDLARRDFTINAMALKVISPQTTYTPQTKGAVYPERSRRAMALKILKIKNLRHKLHAICHLIDPYHGQQDLKNCLIRAVGDPHERFNEDALRMMRAVRIATELGFTIEDETFHAIQNLTHLLKHIAAERIHMEFLKLLKSEYAADGILILKNSGLLALILPELEAAFATQQKSPGRHHLLDVGTHSIESLRHCPSKDPITRLATLIHDLGKVKTQKISPEGAITFYNHELVSTRIARSLADRLRLSRKEKDKLVILVRYHQFTVDEHQTDSAIRRFIRNIGQKNLQDMLDLRTGDRLGGGARQTSWRLEKFKARLTQVQKQPFTIHDLKITGHDVMKVLHLTPGPQVGKILDQLFEEVVEGKIKNNKKSLLSRLTTISSDYPK